MVTAASTANLAIILIDARKGVLTQTRRHSKLASLVGIPHLVVAINKMDLVDYSQEPTRRSRPTTSNSPPRSASTTCASSRSRRSTAT
jgi:sulfate adenylyltransferase subunit 1 (EFTu-like GTPase family)